MSDRSDEPDDLVHPRVVRGRYDVVGPEDPAGVEAYAVEADLAKHQDVVRMLDDIEAKGTAVYKATLQLCHSARFQLLRRTKLLLNFLHYFTQ